MCIAFYAELHVPVVEFQNTINKERIYNTVAHLDKYRSRNKMFEIWWNFAWASTQIHNSLH